MPTFQPIRRAASSVATFARSCLARRPPWALPLIALYDPQPLLPTARKQSLNALD